MENAVVQKAPAHLWIVGGLGTLWNGFGAYDYFMTRSRNTDYLASMMPNVDPQATLDWIDAFPAWASFGWGLGVWMGLLGCVLLLLRNRWSVPVLGLSAIGAILGLGYQIAAAPPLAGTEGDPMMTIMPWVIIAIALGLLLYARAMAKRGVLK